MPVPGNMASVEYACTIVSLSAMMCLALLARRRHKANTLSARLLERPKSSADETLVISLGCTCLTAHVLSKWGVRRFACPFDWLFTTPQMVAHVVTSGSSLLARLHLYQVASTPAKIAHAIYTPMLLDSQRRCSNHRRVNKQGVIFNHHDPTSDADRAYFQRALRRLSAALPSPLPKLCILTSAERRLAVSDDELDALLATLAAHSSTSAPIELVAVRLLAPRVVGEEEPPAAEPRVHCRRTRTEQHASLRCIDLACRGGFTDSGLALRDAADMLDLARACFGSEASLDVRGRLVASIASAADPAVDLETSDNDHVRPCGKMAPDVAGWAKEKAARTPRAEGKHSDTRRCR